MKLFKARQVAERRFYGKQIYCNTCKPLNKKATLTKEKAVKSLRKFEKRAMTIDDIDEKLLSQEDRAIY